MKAIVYDKSHPVAIAVEPQRSEAIEKAKQYALNMVNMLKAELEANEWDARKVADYPSSYNCNREEYSRKVAKFRFCSMVTEGLKSTHRMNEPSIVKMDDEGIARFVREAGEQASFQYDAFICKMIEKIGECNSATLEGSHVWGYSFLIVNKAGVKETWKTQQIVNVSKLGTPFNQWPSRKVKN